MVSLAHPRRGARLTLRAFEERDLDELAAILGDVSVNRYLYSAPRDRDGAREALRRRRGEAGDEAEGPVLHVAVVLNDTGTLIGDFILHWRDDEHHQGEIGGSLHPAHHGRGYAAEVYAELLELAFDEYGLHRVVGRCDARNAASIRALEKAGLRREAHFLENEFVKGEWTDEVVLAILRREWVARRSSDPPAR